MWSCGTTKDCGEHLPLRGAADPARLQLPGRRVGPQHLCDGPQYRRRPGRSLTVRFRCDVIHELGAAREWRGVWPCGCL
jgi:hypothetical protein